MSHIKAIFDDLEQYMLDWNVNPNEATAEDYAPSIAEEFGLEIDLAVEAINTVWTKWNDDCIMTGAYLC